MLNNVAAFEKAFKNQIASKAAVSRKLPPKRGQNIETKDYQQGRVLMPALLVLIGKGN